MEPLVAVVVGRPRPAAVTGNPMSRMPHDPNRVNCHARGGHAHCVVCGECAQLGKGSTVTTDTGVYAG